MNLYIYIYIYIYIYFKNHIQTTLLISFVLFITISVSINYFICNLNIFYSCQ